MCNVIHSLICLRTKAIPVTLGHANKATIYHLPYFHTPRLPLLRLPILFSFTLVFICSPKFPPFFPQFFFLFNYSHSPVRPSIPRHN